MCASVCFHFGVFGWIINSDEQYNLILLWCTARWKRPLRSAADSSKRSWPKQSHQFLVRHCMTCSCPSNEPDGLRSSEDTDVVWGETKSRLVTLWDTQVWLKKTQNQTLKHQSILPIFEPLLKSWHQGWEHITGCMFWSFQEVGFKAACSSILLDLDWAFGERLWTQCRFFFPHPLNLFLFFAIQSLRISGAQINADSFHLSCNLQISSRKYYFRDVLSGQH